MNHIRPVVNSVRIKSMCSFPAAHSTGEIKGCYLDLIMTLPSRVIDYIHRFNLTRVVSSAYKQPQSTLGCIEVDRLKVLVCFTEYYCFSHHHRHRKQQNTIQTKYWLMVAESFWYRRRSKHVLVVFFQHFLNIV